MKNLLILFSLCLVIHLSAQELPTTLKEAYETYQDNFPTEKIYLHTDRTLYKPGEILWLSAYLVNEQLKETQQSQILFVELINPKGNVERRINLRKQGETSYKGDFVVGSGNVGGIYKIRAYTNWMRNWGEDFYFEKEITVQNVIAPRLLMKLDFEKEAYSAEQEVVAELEVREPNDEPLFDYALEYKISIDGKVQHIQKAKTDKVGKAKLKFKLPSNLTTTDGLINVLIDFEGSTESISRSIPIVLNNVSIQFFPEGGYLMKNMKNRVAFEALNEFGKPADIKGVIKNKAGRVVAQLNSYHQGLGAFELDIKTTDEYYAELSRPSKQKFDLPEIIFEGIGIRQTALTETKASYYLHTYQSQTLHIIAEIGGQVYHRQTIKNAKNGIIDIKTDDLPMGIMKLTVFDEQLRPQVERLTFINAHREISVQVKFDKERYEPRQLVQMSITAQDNTGKGVVGNFSASIVEDKWHTFADDKQDNILSYLLMSSELRGEIYEPNFYFDKKEAKASQALDYVMMTHGWRRFGWREVLENERDKWASQITVPQDVFFVTGTVNLNGKSIKGAKVYLEGQEAKAVRTDENGNYKITIPKGTNTYTRNRIVAYYKGFKAEHYIYWNTYLYDLPKLNSDNEVSASISDLKNNVLKVKVEEVKPAEAKPIVAVDKIAKILKSDVSGAVVNRSSIQSIPPISRSSLSVQSINLSEVVTVGYGAVNNFGSYSMDLNVDTWSRPSLSIRPTYSNQGYYYYGRNFYAPNYSYYRNYNKSNRNPHYVSSRTDFRKTLFFAPFLKTNTEGKAHINFYASDENTTFRAIVEGISDDGQVGRTEKTFTVQSPFNIELKAPSIVTTNDNFVVSVLMKNNTDKDMTIEVKEISRHYPTYFSLASNAKKTYTVPANSFINKHLYLDAGTTKANRYLNLNFISENFNEQRYAQVRVEPKGFKTGLTISGNDVTKTATFQIDDMEQGSLRAQFTAYSNIVGQLMDGVKGMIREPHGCFEQVSSSNYPNIYALKYMNEMGIEDKQTRKLAKGYLAKAYIKLAGYESNGGGFDWYGESPADERLTAYGLMEFMDMKDVYSRVDQNMIDRTAAWLSSRMNADGSWKGRYHYYNRYTAVHNAYITHAMTLYGKINVQQSIDLISQEARESKDWYRLSLAAMSNWNAGNVKEAKDLLDILVSEIENNGLENINTEKTITYSYGNSRNIETLSLIAQALIQQKRDEHTPLIHDCIQKIVNSRSSLGYYYSTQATIQALKTLVEYARNFDKEPRSGAIYVKVNDRQLPVQYYDSREPRLIQFTYGKYLQQGENTIEVTFKNTKKAIPYATQIGWNTLKPQSSPNCKIDLNTTIATKNTKVGEVVRITSTISNTSNEDVFNPIALIGIPAGLSLQPWQLKELKEKTAFDYYEVQDNYLVMYFRHLKVNEEKVINLDLKAEIAGIYKASANSAYLYYGAEDKKWEEGLTVTITP